MHQLDRPVWTALNTGWSHLAEGGGLALRLDPTFGPFAAAANRSEAAQTALARLVPPDGELWVVEAEAADAPPGLKVVRQAALTQMVAEDIAPIEIADGWIELSDRDAAEMRALAALTEPGPFARRTHEFGFVGIRREGALVAMAGERMSLPGLREVSGVCTHPESRGKGYAAMLMSIIIKRIVGRGETPFLHSYAGNAGAIALYQRLGFRVRRQMTVTMMASDPGA